MGPIITQRYQEHNPEKKKIKEEITLLQNWKLLTVQHTEYRKRHFTERDIQMANKDKKGGQCH